jgi:prevent-host-death family protein
MAEIPSRELRNNVSEVLRRVEAGERLTVTVSGRPVAELVPLQRKPTFIPWDEFMSMPKADPAMLDDIKAVLDATTKEDDDEWPHWLEDSDR